MEDIPLKTEEAEGEETYQAAEETAEKIAEEEQEMSYDDEGGIDAFDIAAELNMPPPSPIPGTSRGPVDTRDAATNIPDISNSSDPEISQILRDSYRMTVDVEQKWKIRSVRQARCDLAYTVMVASTGNSFELCEDVPVRRMFELLNPAWNIRPAEYYSSVMCDFVVQQMRQHLNDLLVSHIESAQFIALSANVIANKGERKFIAIYHHHASSDFQYETNMLGCLEMTTGAANNQLTNDFDLMLTEGFPQIQQSEKTIYLTYDTTIPQFSLLLKDSIHAPVGIPCQSQQMISVIRKAFQSVPEANEVLEVAMTLNGILLQNSEVADELAAICKRRDGKYILCLKN